MRNKDNNSSIRGDENTSSDNNNSANNYNKENNSYNNKENNNDGTNTMVYIGLCTRFKERYNNHTHSFRNPDHETKTELYKYGWQLKRTNTPFTIRWKIIETTSGFNNISKRCQLCLAEKYQICNFKDRNRLLNKKNELVSKCRHENSYLLKSFH